jgi:hypothetical protein
MDRDRLMMLLDGFYVPNTNNVSVASVVDREPLGIIGNSLVYRVGAASFLGYGKVTTPAELYNVYAEKEPISNPVLLSLPTDGCTHRPSWTNASHSRSTSVASIGRSMTRILIWEPSILP